MEMIPGGYEHRAPCTLRLPARRTRLWGEEHCLNVGIAPSPLFHHFRLTDDKLASIFPKSPSGLGRGGVRSGPWDTVTPPSLGSVDHFQQPKKHTYIPKPVVHFVLRSLLTWQCITKYAILHFSQRHLPPEGQDGTI